MAGYIYKITNKIDGKIYIGQTTKTPQQRFLMHVSSARSGLNTRFAEAIRTYGPDAFTVEILEITKKSSLDTREIHWISKLKSYEPDIGYNRTNGGSGGNTYVFKSDKEMEEIRDKIRKSKIGELNPNHTAVKCYNIITEDEFHFSTVEDCARFFNRNNHNFITARCQGRIKFMYDGVWMFAYEDCDYSSEYQRRKRNHRAKKIQIRDLETDLDYEFNSFADAERYFDLRKGALSSKAYLYASDFIVQKRFYIHIVND